jgi:hypothetical protein
MDTYCNGCKTFKASSEFIGSEANGISKQLKTCNNCRQRFTIKRKKLEKTDDDLLDSELELVDLDHLSETITELLENVQSELHFHYEIDISNYNNSSKDIANEIVKLIEDADRYNWIYNQQYKSKESTTYWYYCSQRNILSKKPRKNPDLLRQRDVPSMKRFECDGILKISINKTTQVAKVSLYHKDLHAKPIDTSIPQDIKNFIASNIDLLPREIYARLINSEDIDLPLFIKQKQIHFWWTQLGQDRYKRCNDAFESAYTWLLENKYEILLYEVEPVHVLAFDTGILDQINKLGIIINEYGIDATYNTNNMGFELYVLHVEVNGTGFPLSYLFLENNGQCKERIRTGVIQKFFTIFQNQGLQPKFFLTDKDFAQINVIRFTWPQCKIQLCKWHVKRAIITRLSSNKSTRSSGFNPLSELGKQFPFDGIQQAAQFCPKELRKTVWSIMEKHMHQHPLIPTSDGQFLTIDTIYEASVQEMYLFCKNNSLISYLWTEWYSNQKWKLWARSSCADMIPILKTTMFIEGHWKVIKRLFI